MIFNFTVRGDKITAEKDYGFTEGNKGSYEAVFTFSEEWEKLAKICVVTNNGEAFPVAMTDNRATIPLLEKMSAKIGVIGVELLEDGKQAVRLSTNLESIGVSSGAASSEALDALSMAAEVWEKYLNDMEDSRKAAEGFASEAQETLESVKNIAEAAEESKNAAKEAVSDAESAVKSAENAVADARNAVNEARGAVGEAQAEAENAREEAERAQGFAQNAQRAVGSAQTEVENARKEAEKAEEATTRNPVIIDGYWWVWSAPREAYINTGIRAQAGSEVYIGDNPPDSADVWIDPNGESAIYAPYIGENGNWYTFNPETQTFTDSGNRAVAKDGYTPVKGEDYWTPEEEAEMRNSINGAVEDATASAEQSAVAAEESKESAQQVLSDLLAMINSGDIVLATGGKLPLSAIPATATQEIYTVTSEDELTSLTAQRGDLAELIEEVDGEQTITKTWQCLDDSSVRENWVVWGTSYAVQSGNATTADNALNANTINNHRIVEMAEEDFQVAVKDENTYYLVY